MKIKIMLLVIGGWLLVGGGQLAVSGQGKDVVENKDSTELAQLTKQLNDLNTKIANSKISLYDRKEQVEADEKNLDLMEIDLQITKYAIGKQKELIEAKKLTK